MIVELNSPGGDVKTAASGIYANLKNYKGSVTVQIVGLAASAASVIAMAGDPVLMSITAQIMIHNVSTIARGDHRVMDHQAEVLRINNESIASAYHCKTGIKLSKLLEMMDHETWLNANEAKRD
ncbi:MAG: Clp protease ClpP [Desulfosporosinus sp.]|nr:Clp protease ClpP [Desulfosporosinus sp.]